jgi:hypothetical protein
MSGGVSKEAQTTKLNLEAVPNQPGEYRGEMVAQVPGNYSYSTQRDVATVLKFQVEESTAELTDTALNEKLLNQMASLSGGRFLREEDLNDLPNLIAGKSTALVSFKKIPLTTHQVWLGLLIFTACAEWLWRRRLELK